MSDEWGPWIEHDGRGCPCVGQYVHVRYKNPAGLFIGPNGELDADRAGAVGVASGSPSWAWAPHWNPIIRYRIRKPRALKQLREIARNPERELEDA